MQNATVIFQEFNPNIENINSILLDFYTLMNGISNKRNQNYSTYSEC